MRRAIVRAAVALALTGLPAWLALAAPAQNRARPCEGIEMLGFERGPDGDRTLIAQSCLTGPGPILPWLDAPGPSMPRPEELGTSGRVQSIFEPEDLEGVEAISIEDLLDPIRLAPPLEGSPE